MDWSEAKPLPCGCVKDKYFPNNCRVVSEHCDSTVQLFEGYLSQLQAMFEAGEPEDESVP